MIKYVETKIKAALNELNKHSFSPMWVISTIAVITSLVIKYYIYIYELGRCNYWNVSSNAIDITTNNIFELLFELFIALLLLIYIYAISKTLVFDKSRIIISFIRFLLINIALYSLTYVFILFFDESTNETLTASAIIYGLLFFIALVYKVFKNKTKEKGTTVIYSLIIIMLIASFCVYKIGYNQEHNRKLYDVIDNEYIIVYSDSDNYYLVKYNELTKTINKNIHKQLSKNGVEYEIKILEIGS